MEYDCTCTETVIKEQLGCKKRKERMPSEEYFNFVDGEEIRRCCNYMDKAEKYCCTYYFKES